jgi:hypothetical protein
MTWRLRTQYKKSMTKSWFFFSPPKELVLQKDKSIKKKSLARERREKIQIRSEKKRETIIHLTETQKIIRNYYKQPYANKFDNLEEMDKFLDTYTIP